MPQRLNTAELEGADGLGEATETVVDEVSVGRERIGEEDTVLRDRNRSVRCWPNPGTRWPTGSR